ncbi:MULTISPECIES: hypothetical protein [Chelativorans]|jgi:hypothetical protein|uniref:DUF3617 family protein n=1 Tax=Chelativorans sp. (strain BNC1) TaxID=266779 RepID=Q11I57_CHESB|nr:MULTISPECIES: hypothetical protein [Chelativorans]
MRTSPLACALLFSCLLVQPSLAQAPTGPNNSRGAADDVDRDESPVIVSPDRAGGQSQENPNDFRNELESFVQVRGTWASDQAACASAEGGSGQGLYITDTMIRSEGATCSVRDVETTGDTAQVYTSCTIGGEQSERTFTLQKTGADTLSVTSPVEGAERTLTVTRCPDK